MPEAGMGPFPGRRRSPEGGLSERVIRKQLETILASETFSRSGRLRAFLRFVVEEALQGRAETLKEQVLAAELYGNNSATSGDDNPVVRVDARRLRDKLREFYAEYAAEPVIISLPKGGYAPVFEPRDVAPATLAGSSTSKRLLLAATLAIAGLAAVLVYQAASAPGPKPRPAGTLSIAVLPFIDLSPSKDMQYLCDGLTEELIASLTGLPALRVAPRATVFQYKGRPVDMPQIGEELKVQAVLEGSVRVEDGRVRVIAQLVSTANGFHLWKHTWENEVSDGSDTQREVASEISRSFRWDLHSTQRALVRPPSSDTEAWQHYLRAAELSYAPLKSLEHYLAAVAADPDYALAWAGLSLMWTKAVDWGEADPTDGLQEGAEAARRALVLDPTLPEAHHAMARIKVYAEHDWAGAGESFRRAMKLDPTYFDARLDYARLALVPIGRFDEAVQELQRALALFPSDNLLLNELANTYIKARQYSKALDPLDASRKISDTQPAPYVFQGMAANGLGDHEEALRLFQKAVSIRRTSWTLNHLGYTYAKLDRRDEALKIIAELRQTPAGRPAYDYEIATIFAALGDTDAAFAALEMALASQSQGLIWIKVDYKVDDLRADPRFGLFLTKMRLN